MLFFVFFPLFLKWGEGKWRVVRWISPVIICYGVGLLMANLPFLDLNNEWATSISEVSVLLAIPLLLFSSRFLEWLKVARTALISFMLSVFSVVLCAAVMAFLFRDYLENAAELAGMTVGVYTGGTPNMSAIGLSLEVDESLYILLNASDLVCGAFYLFFLMTIARPLLGRFYRPYPNVDSSADHSERSGQSSTAVTPQRFLIFFAMAVAILGLVIGASLLLFGSMKAVFIILMVTTVGIVLSFNRRIRETRGSYELGEYFLLVFFFLLGSLADLSELIASASTMFGFTAAVMFSSISLHYLLAYFFKVDRDTLIITSVAAIYGPAFVGPIAKVLDNKAIVLTGMTTGLVGYAIGNYIGIGLANVLIQWLG